MAERRMFNKTLLLSNQFTDLSKNAQLLYLFLNLQADDDGICGNSRTVCRVCGCSAKALQELIDGGWLLAFEKGEVAVTHWLIHNQIRKDRYKPSIYRQAASRLKRNADGTYGLCEEGCQNDDQSATQGSLDQESIAQDSIAQDSIGQDRPGKENAGCPSAGPPDAACDDEIDYERILYYYQCFCGNLMPCEALTPKLREKMALCHREGYTYQTLTGTFIRANRSSFLQGENRRGWRADLGWLLDPLHIREVDAGKYDTWM